MAEPLLHSVAAKRSGVRRDQGRTGLGCSG